MSVYRFMEANRAEFTVVDLARVLEVYALYNKIDADSSVVIADASQRTPLYAVLVKSIAQQYRLVK